MRTSAARGLRHGPRGLFLARRRPQRHAEAHCGGHRRPRAAREAGGPRLPGRPPGRLGLSRHGQRLAGGRLRGRRAGSSARREPGGPRERQPRGVRARGPVRGPSGRRWRAGVSAPPACAAELAHRARVAVVTEEGGGSGGGTVAWPHLVRRRVLSAPEQGEVSGADVLEPLLPSETAEEAEETRPAACPRWRPTSLAVPRKSPRTSDPLLLSHVVRALGAACQWSPALCLQLLEGVAHLRQGWLQAAGDGGGEGEAGQLRLEVFRLIRRTCHVGGRPAAAWWFAADKPGQWTAVAAVRRAVLDVVARGERYDGEHLGDAEQDSCARAAAVRRRGPPDVARLAPRRGRRGRGRLRWRQERGLAAPLEGCLHRLAQRGCADPRLPGGRLDCRRPAAAHLHLQVLTRDAGTAEGPLYPLEQPDAGALLGTLAADWARPLAEALADDHPLEAPAGATAARQFCAAALADLAAAAASPRGPGTPAEAHLAAAGAALLAGRLRERCAEVAVPAGPPAGAE
ncbi:unnamed protein product, partial [Prorocentrum cordatum]